MIEKFDRLWERGSGMVMAIFVLFLVTSLGVALLFLSNTEVKLSQADGRGKVAYYYSEAGLEKARALVHYANFISSDIEYFSDELAVAAGADGNIDFNLASLSATFDSDGNLTSLSGFNDDRPAFPLASFAGGMHAAFLTNDPAEGIANPIDNNKKVMLTGVGAGPDRSLEIVQAIVQRVDLYPVPPATITILGEQNCMPNCAQFDGGTSTPKRYRGDDAGTHCPGGDPTLHVPVVGVIGNHSVGSAQTGVIKPASYTSGTEVGIDTVKDLTAIPGLDPTWTDCGLLRDLAMEIRDAADIIGDSSTPNAALGTVADPKIAFIVGDYVVGPAVSSAGILFVTGTLDFHGQADWQGIIFAVGEGDFLRNGSGNGEISGSVVVADISGPDRILFTADDCSGEDGILGNGDDGIAQSTYYVPGGGVGVTGYCSSYLLRWQAAKPLEIVSFIQR